jgi:hypothetical protein
MWPLAKGSNIVIELVKEKQNYNKNINIAILGIIVNHIVTIVGLSS